MKTVGSEGSRNDNGCTRHYFVFRLDRQYDFAIYETVSLGTLVLFVLPFTVVFLLWLIMWCLLLWLLLVWWAGIIVLVIVSIRVISARDHDATQRMRLIKIAFTKNPFPLRSRKHYWSCTVRFAESVLRWPQRVPEIRAMPESPAPVGLNSHIRKFGQSKFRIVPRY